MKKLIYFGCIREAGHFFWQSDSHQLYHYEKTVWVPELNPNLFHAIDGVFTPWFADRREHQGIYQESIVPPVRIVAWWDRSVDERGACNSALIGYGYGSAEEILDAAVIQFPSVMSRQPRPVPTAVPVKGAQ